MLNCISGHNPVSATSLHNAPDLLLECETISIFLLSIYLGAIFLENIALLIAL
jgi:hypothetical protein